MLRAEAHARASERGWRPCTGAPAVMPEGEHAARREEGSAPHPLSDQPHSVSLEPQASWLFRPSETSLA